jgi:hypothetical protein
MSAPVGFEYELTVPGWVDKSRSNNQGAAADKCAEFFTHPCLISISLRRATSCRMKSPTVRKIEFKPEPVTVTDGKKESLFEKAASLYDKIAKPVDKTLAGQATRQPVSNIKAAIGINEKFAYLKELFKNNVNDYNEALEKLNNFESYAEAEDYFQELKAKYDWDSESKSFQGLADLLNRRYLHNA